MPPSRAFRRLVAPVVAALAAAACATSDESPEALRPAQQQPAPQGPATGPVDSGTGRQPYGLEVIPEVVAEVAPSVVAVLARGGEGSGVIWDQDGTIVTNAHVVGAADEVVVVFADGKRAPAEVVATDEVVDIAVLQAKRDQLPPATFSKDLPAVGELAIVMGNPLGFENTVTAGIISGVRRAIPGSGLQTQSLVDLIQTDAPISPGNSGGALVSGAGEVVGINVAYIPPQARAVSIGFAIPAATVVEVVTELLADGQATHAYLGILPGQVTPSLAQEFDIERRDGVLVLDVSGGGPADRAGVQGGDVIVGIGGEPVTTVEQFLAELRDVEPGQRVELTVLRDGDERTLDVEVGDRP
ncbi:MAG TPA: trypsin-like peptidase domain-containing protein [Acidimicrobiales bacterium]|nr:trypsin-like peptidase domain-containing protein [Acidimicrobiales bacterium]